MKCPFCKSENTERIPGGTMVIKNIPERNVRYGNIMCTESSTTLRVTAKKQLCLDCGFIFEKLSEADLKRYKEE